MSGAPSQWSGPQCAVSAPSVRVVEEAAAWEALWEEAFDAPAPPVDFARSCAVAVFAGLKPTGGFSIEFLPPEADGDGLLVPARLRAPAAGGFVTQAFTQPWAIRLYDRPKGPLRAEERR
ncbi:MAG: protease complex subunit PrcB family protein [Elusimicrobia bacterium]|nr:protease complex subunit PrcB family protein [Elusimicrobiota bacterium]